MAQSGWRLPDDLLKRVRVHCAESGERQNEFVRQALENALAERPLSPAASAALRAAWDSPALMAQLTEEPKPAKKPPAELPRIAPRHWGKS